IPMSTSNAPVESADHPRLTALQWVICGVASLGFAFDTYVLLMLPLIVGPALSALGGLKPGTPEYNSWVGMLFYIPALARFLAGRMGCPRIRVWGFPLYAFSAGGSAYTTSLPLLPVLRWTAFIGVCVEFVAGVACVAELFPIPKQREAVLGYTQALSSFGG